MKRTLSNRMLGRVYRSTMVMLALSCGLGCGLLEPNKTLEERFRENPTAAAKYVMKKNLQVGVNPDDVLKAVVSGMGEEEVSFGMNQGFRGIPVNHGRMIVFANLKSEMVTSVQLNRWKFIERSTSIKPWITEEQARDLALQASPYDLRALPWDPISSQGLEFFFKDGETKPHLTWVIVMQAIPYEVWYRIDAHTGEVVDEFVFAMSATGTGTVFDPNPRRTDGPGYTWDHTTPYDTLASAYKTRSLLRLDPPSGGYYRLRGDYAWNADPYGVAIASSTFDFTRADTEFVEVMSYYFIDKMQEYFRSRFTPPDDPPMMPNEVYFLADTTVSTVGYREVGGVTHSILWLEDPRKSTPSYEYYEKIKDGEDGDIVIHEYGHIIHKEMFWHKYSTAANFTGSEEFFVTEGFGDYLALSYATSIDTFEHDIFGNWDIPPTSTNDSVYQWDGPGIRRLDDSDYDMVPDRVEYPTHNVYGPGGDTHVPAGVLWATTLMDIENEIGSRDHAASIIFEGHYKAAYDYPKMIDYASWVLTAAGTYQDGTYFDEVYDVLTNRGFTPLTIYGVAGSVVTVPSDLTVANGDTLIISKNATVHFSGGKLYVNSSGIVLVDSGATLKFADNKELYVRGKLTAHRATFTRAAGATQWTGIEAMYNVSQVTLDTCTVEYAAKGLYASGYNPTAAPLVQITGGTFRYNDWGVYLHKALSSSFVTNADVDENEEYGVYVNYCQGMIGDTQYPSNAMDHNTGGGIYVQNYAPTIQCNNLIYNGDVGSGIGIYLQSSDPIVNYNDVLANGEYGLYCYDSSPLISWNWFEGARSSEVYVTEGSYPMLGEYSAEGDGHNNSLITSATGCRTPGCADYAIDWGTNNTDAAIYAYRNWWGSNPPPPSAELFDPPGPGYINYDPYLTSAPRAAPSTGTPKPAVVAQMEEAKDEFVLSSSVDRHHAIVEQYPNSLLAHHALRRIFADMLNREHSQQTIEAYFTEQASRTEHPFVRYTAEEMVRKAMAWFGDHERAIDAYRAVAESNHLPDVQRRTAWLKIAHLADETGNDPVLNESLTHVIALGDSTETARVARRWWPDRMESLVRPPRAIPPNILC